ncbi:MAG: single-stranded-DNA-specific exonuclease RecJ [Elusimicrobia bacterium RIFCSPLOWO2_01_FULL_60_11]|nr:MAG: single-stranded-DNA-specific exonuclease RecJ [Elusimicrobia bacterium RIFCSPLOWO2_01_FULL_60_11]
MRPGLSDLHNAFLMPDMEKAVLRLRSAIDKKEKILIYGDSDVDGVTSIAILMRTLGNLGAAAEWVIPGAEGYGLHASILEKYRKEGVGLVVTVDNGTSAVEEIGFANSIGLDVIVTDHHSPPDVLPKALAIVNPNLKDSVYPYKSLAGCLSAFKLAQGLMFSFNRAFNQDYCVVDLETTGLSPTNGTIVEIAAVHIRNFVPVATFHTLVNPERPIPPEVTRIHGITDDMVKDAPVLEQVLPKFLKFLGDKTIVAHNAPFDMGFLKAFCKLILDEDIKNLVVDTLALARQHLQAESHALTHLVEKFKIERQTAHRALDDVLATVALFEIIERARDPRLDHFLQDHLDLACLGTIADVVPLLGENRVIVKEGIPRLLNTKKPGLKELLLACGIFPGEAPPSAKDISWTVTPHLNAAGRFDRADLTARLLLTESNDEARTLVKEIVQLNKDRKNLQKLNLDKFLKLAKEQCDVVNDPIIFVVAEGLRIGVTGIVASHLVREFSRPALLLIVENGVATGSSRSIPSVNMVEILKECEDLIVKYGGHPQAAGMTVESRNIPALKERVLEAARGRIDSKTRVPQVEIEHDLGLEEITKALVNEVAMLEPFGQGNPLPVFSLRGAFLKGVTPIGAQKNHLKLVVGDSARSVDGVAWSMAHRLEELSVGAGHDFVFNLEMDRWNGREAPRLVIVDLCTSSGSAGTEPIQLDLVIG